MKRGEATTLARRPDSRDAEVSLRVRSRRLECRLSQTQLADQIGVTFQQVQKYERGLNRIGAGRLARIAEALDVPITFFFGDAKAARAPKGKIETVFDNMQDPSAIRLVKALDKIESRESRLLVVAMAEHLAVASNDRARPLDKDRKRLPHRRR